MRNMLDFGFFNMDCMDGMKEFPDKYFDLAIVDPPYGDGKHLSDNSGGGIGTGSADGSTSTKINRGGVARKTEVLHGYTSNGRTAGSQTERGVTRTGGTWARKYTKKLLRGTLRRSRNILMNCFASHGIKLSGVVITFHYRRQDAF